MNLTQLEYFVCICQNQSISRAAEKLFISQSALSQQLSRLEGDLGVPLFKRYGNTISLTEYGAKFLDGANRILFEYRNVIGALSEAKHQSSLSIAVTKTKSFITLTYLLPGFRKLYPHTDIQIKEVDSYQVEKLLLHGDADLGFCYNSEDSDLVYHPIYSEPVLLAVPPLHPLTSRPFETDERGARLIPFSAVADEPFVIGTCGYLRQYTLEMFEQKGRQPHIAMETANPGMDHLLVAANIGLAFVGEISTWVAPMHIQNPVYCLLKEDANKRMNVAVAHHKRKYLSPEMKQFIRYAADCLNAHGRKAVTP